MHRNTEPRFGRRSGGPRAGATRASVQFEIPAGEPAEGVRYARPGFGPGFGSRRRGRSFGPEGAGEQDRTRGRRGEYNPEDGGRGGFEPGSLGRGGFGPGGFGPGGFGPGSFGPGGGRGRGGHRGRRPRGDVRAAILLLLQEEPRHGYDLINTIAERSGGAWTPSPGSVYPTLQALQDEGLVQVEEVDGRRTASLTEAGQTYLKEHLDELGTPWKTPGDAALIDGRKAFGALFFAARQVAQVGTEAQRQQALEVINRARRELYGILASDSGAETASEPQGEPADNPQA